MEGVTIVLIGILLTLGQPGLSLLNLSKGRPTNSSDFREGKGPSSLVVDGNDSDFLSDPNNAAIPQCLYTISNQKTTFWQVDLEQRVVIDHVEVISRRGGIGQRTHQIRRNGYSIIVTASSRYLPITQADICYSDTDPALSSANHENQSCSNIGRYITIYNQRETLSGSDYSLDAVLELCEVKVMGCPINKHGLNCSEDCPARCTNNLCFPGNGTCMRGCKPGYTGSACEKPCDNYFFGQDCASACFCKAGPCTIVEGKCPHGGCDPGYIGTSCSTERICQNQTEVNGCHDSLANTKDVTGYAILGTVLAISVFYNIGLTVFYLRQSRKIKTPPKPSTAYEMQPNSVSQDHSNYEGLDITKVDNVKNIYETIGK